MNIPGMQLESAHLRFKNEPTGSHLIRLIVREVTGTPLKFVMIIVTDEKRWRIKLARLLGCSISAGPHRSFISST
jgi:hypothetical protein